MTKSSVRRVGTHEAKTRLSELLRAVEAGEEIEILRGRDVIARLVPAVERHARRLGEDSGLFTVPDDFDAALPEEVTADFER